MPAPKSNAAKAAAGTLRPCRVKRDPLDRLTEAPARPGYLSEAGAVQWRRIVDEAVDVGITRADLRALVLLCECLATENQLREAIERDGPTIATAEGGAKAHPALAGLAQARAQSRALLSDLGLTPKGRANHPVPPAPDKYADPFQDF